MEIGPKKRFFAEEFLPRLKNKMKIIIYQIHIGAIRTIARAIFVREIKC